MISVRLLRKKKKIGFVLTHPHKRGWKGGRKRGRKKERERERKRRGGRKKKRRGGLVCWVCGLMVAGVQNGQNRNGRKEL